MISAAEIRGLLSQIQHLTPQLKDAMDEAGRAVRRIESFLADRGIGLAFCLEVMGQGDGEAVVLHYQRVRDEFRIAVEVQKMPGLAMPDGRLVPWVECPRHVKMLTFPHIPDLLKVIVGGLAAEIEKIRRTTRLAEEMMAAFEPGALELHRASAS